MAFLKWNTYKNLTKQQKEEYEFKFSNGMNFNIVGLLTLTITLISISMLFLMSSYVIIKEPSLSMYVSDITMLYTSVARILTATIFIVLLFIFEYVVKVVTFIYKFEKWKKINKVKRF